MSNTVILAYSGGLDTSALVPWLQGEHGSTSSPASSTWAA